jgi:UDP-4-amino-4-deoxy-L-arabinose-oxoglutarate aminotransferase
MNLITHSKPWISDSDIESVEKVMLSGMIAKGEHVRAFESAVSRYLGTPESVAVGSGTAALVLAMRAMGIGKGDEVILPTYVCISVANAVKAVGAVPVLCDVGICWNMTPEEVEKRITGKTKAIILVHIFGIASDPEPFLGFNIPVIEDCCQAFGASANGRKTGTAGKVGIFSFNAIKCLTTGEGGMATSSDSALISRMKELRSSNAVPSPMTDIQAVLGLSQLSRYDEILSRRAAIAEKYFSGLPKNLTERISGVRRDSMFFRFPLIASEDFEEARRHFESRGIAVRKGVDSLIHRQFGLSDAQFRNATELFNNTISLPIYPALSQEEAGAVLGEAVSYWRR